METKNAIIRSATITYRDRGFLDCIIDLEYGCTTQTFGGYVLYLPKSFSAHKINSPAGHFIFRVMEVAGVEKWDELKGKTIRVRADNFRVVAIGHIVKDDWFTPAEVMREVGPLA